MPFQQESRSVSPFIAYALCASEEALSDANWHPRDSEGLERTVRMNEWYLLVTCNFVFYVIFLPFDKQN